MNMQFTRDAKIANIQKWLYWHESAKSYYCGLDILDQTRDSWSLFTLGKDYIELQDKGLNQCPYAYSGQSLDHWHNVALEHLHADDVVFG